MDEFKIELGYKESNGELPRFRAAAPDDYHVVWSTLRILLKNETLIERAVYETISDLPALGQAIGGDPGELSLALREGDLEAPEEVFIFFPSGKGLDEIDIVRFEDLDNHLDYYWYPSRDDMMVLSTAEVPWCLYISHFGSVQCAC